MDGQRYFRNGLNRLFRKWQGNRTDENFTAYIKSRNRAKLACRGAQRRQEATIANEAKTNPKAFWNFVRSRTKSKTGVAEGNPTETRQRQT